MLACPFCGRFSRGAADLDDHLGVDHDGVAVPGHLNSFRPWVGTMRGTVVVPVDPAFQLTTAFRLGATLSHQAQLGLEVITVPSRGGEAAARVYLRSAAHRAREIGAASSRWSLLAAADSTEATDGLVDHLATTRPDLVCMSAGHQSPAMLGEFTASVVQRTSVPVIVIGPHGIVADRIDRIVVLEDGPTTVAEVLEPLVALGRRLGAEVVIRPREQVPAGSLVAVALGPEPSLVELGDLVETMTSPVMVLASEPFRPEP